MLHSILFIVYVLQQSMCFSILGVDVGPLLLFIVYVLQQSMCFSIFGVDVGP